MYKEIITIIDLDIVVIISLLVILHMHINNHKIKKKLD